MKGPLLGKPITHALKSLLAWCAAAVAAASVTYFSLLVLDGVGYGITPRWIAGELLCDIPVCGGLIGLVLVAVMITGGWRARRIGLVLSFFCLPIAAFLAYPYLLEVELYRFLTPGQPIASPAQPTGKIPEPWHWIDHEDRSITNDFYSGEVSRETLVVDKYSEEGSAGGLIVTIQMFREQSSDAVEQLLYVELTEGPVYEWETICPIAYGTQLGLHPTIVIANFDFDSGKEIFVNGANVNSPDNCTDINYFDWERGQLVSRTPDLGLAWLRIVAAFVAPVLLALTDRHWTRTWAFVLWGCITLGYGVLYFGGIVSAWWFVLGLGIVLVQGVLRSGVYRKRVAA
ncbi:MAG TPA: hypothetical protein PLC98_22700 [Anaerolineales bacterium]|nr:hypothetical protein [Anaerolineales bacterium]